MINAKVLATAINRLATLRYFPSDKGVKVELAKMLNEMCSTDEQVEWLANRTTQLYTEWLGPAELRAVMCSRYCPADGIEADSAVFSEGIPSERGNDWKRLETPERPLLEAAANVSPDAAQHCAGAIARSVNFKRKLGSHDYASIRHLYTQDGWPK